MNGTKTSATLLFTALCIVGPPAVAASAKLDVNALQDKPVPDFVEQSHHGNCQLKAAAAGSAVNCSIEIIKKPDGLSSPAGVTFVTIDLNVPQPKGSTVTTLGSLDGLAQSYTLGATASRIEVRGTHAILYGAAVKFGPQSYTWFDPTSLAKTTQRHSTHGLEAFVGATFGKDQRNAAYLRFGDQSTFEDGKAKILCRPAASTTPNECVSGPVGAPQRLQPRVYTVQWARAFQEVGTGMELSISRDTKNKVTGVELPVYLHATKAGKSTLTFGFVAAWSNDPNSPRRGSLAAIFTTDAFTVLR